MAIDPQVYAFSDWQLAVKTEITTLGLAAANPVVNTQLIDIDGPPTFTPGTFMRTDIRSGTPGQIAGNADALVCDKGVYNEVSFSGIYDTTSGVILMPNLFAKAIGSSPAGYEVDYDWTSPTMNFGGAVGADKTLGVSLIHPEPAKSISLVGACLVTATISGDVEEDNGQIKISGTFGTGFKPVYDQTSPTTPTTYGSTKRYLSQATTTKTVAGAATAVIKSFSLTINNPAAYKGFQGANGDPEIIVRGIPELEILLDTTIKVDANTASLYSTMATDTAVATEISYNATWASATNFGFKGDKGRILSIAENDAGAGYYDISQKFFADTSGDAGELII